MSISFAFSDFIIEQEKDEYQDEPQLAQADDSTAKSMHENSSKPIAFKSTDESNLLKGRFQSGPRFTSASVARVHFARPISVVRSRPPSKVNDRLLSEAAYSGATEAREGLPIIRHAALNRITERVSSREEKIACIAIMRNFFTNLSAIQGKRRTRVCNSRTQADAGKIEFSFWNCGERFEQTRNATSWRPACLSKGKALKPPPYTEREDVRGHLMFKSSSHICLLSGQGGRSPAEHRGPECPSRIESYPNLRRAAHFLGGGQLLRHRTHSGL